MHQALLTMVFIFIALTSQSLQAQSIKLVIDAEFGIPGSTSAQAILNGAQVAAKEINAAGGLLGRQLEIVQRDNRGVPARALATLREVAADPDVIAVMCGKYSPVVVELLPEIHRLKIPFLDPWAAADPITDNGFSPNFVFRLSLRDTWAMQVMMDHASKHGALKVGLLLANSEWGRSSLRAAERKSNSDTKQKIVAFEWYNWGDKSLLPQYKNLLSAGAQAIILVANEQEGAILVNELATLPAKERLPIVAHWGITAGRFFELSAPALKNVDLTFVQTFSFINRGNDPVAQQLLANLKAETGNGDPRKIDSPAGVAHAYDLVHLLTRAVRLAGNTDRESIRSAMEKLGPSRGVTRYFNQPFTAQRHDALGIENVFMARFAPDGVIEPLPVARR
jgi:branched-chain amino acid transport system substrate-binding protein